MSEKQLNKPIYQSVYYLASGLIYIAILLRSILIYQGTPYLGEVLGVVLLFLVLFVASILFITRMGRWIHLYLGIQSVLVFLLLINPVLEQYDYFSILFAILGMQAIQYLNYRSGIAWIGIFLILMAIPFISYEGPMEGVIRLVLFGSVVIYMSAYTLAARRAQQARNQNQSLVKQLQKANIQLEAHTSTLKQLGVANERQRLRRELHDSVTQTIFSMTLTTQSALLLLERDPKRVGTQLERLNQLAQSALAEMHTLITELRPDQQPGSDLVAKLRQHIERKEISERLDVGIEIDGDQALSTSEVQGLFRIAQEALNNVVKHAHASQACVRVHMAEPYWLEIVDNGQGLSLIHI